MLAALRRTGIKRLGEFTVELKLFPQVLINIRLETKFDFASSAEIASAVSAAEKELASNGRVLLRASGTEPLIRVMVEGRDRELVKSLAERIAAVVKKSTAG